MPMLPTPESIQAQTLFRLGAQLHADRQLDGQQALSVFEQARQLTPNNPDILNALGAVLARMGRDDQAIARFEQALARQPQHADALENLAGLLHRTRRYAQAAEHCQRWLAQSLQGGQAAPYMLGRLAYTRRLMADWTDDAQRQNQLQQALRSRQRTAWPFEYLGFSDDPAEHLHCARQLVQDRHPPTAPLWTDARWQNPRIRVAYLSNDFCNHATAVLLARVLELHDTSRFEIFALSWTPLQDSMQQRIRAGVEHFIDISGQSDVQVAQWMASQHIDIAIDIKGFAQNYRLGIFAHRPCPIQVNYLGYPGSLGAPYIDYLIADPHVIAPADRLHYSEHLARLPHSYQANDPLRSVAPSCPNRAQLGLPEKGSGTQGFVFACFNNSYKITPDVFGQWMNILKATPGSVLWLLDANDQVPSRLREQAAEHGIDPTRLVFAPRAPTPEHLARHVHADLFLDTFPVNAHTTAADALWMGLPVLTRYGRSFSSRVGLSLLHACQLPPEADAPHTANTPHAPLINTLVDTLAVDQAADYVARAVALAQQPERLHSLRAHLCSHRARLPLFDAALTCRHLEAAYTAMWQRWQNGLAPADITVPATPALKPSSSSAITAPAPKLSAASAQELQKQSLHLLQAGQTEAALSLFDEALKHRPTEATLWQARAHSALRVNSRAAQAQALSDLQQAHRLAPDNERLRYELTLTLEQAGHTPAACEHLGQLESQAPHNTEYPLLHIRLQRKRGQLATALALCQAWTARQARHSGAWVQQASVHLALEQHTEALACVQQALDLQPGNAEALNLRGMLGRAHDLPTPQALADFEQAHAREPHNPYYLSNIAITLDELGQLAQARPWWQRLLRLPTPAAGHPGDVLLLQARGAEQLDDTPQQRQLLQLATEHLPNHFDAWLQYGHSCTSLGQDLQARDAYQHALRIEPDNVHALSALMRAERCVGDWQHHDERLQQVLHAAAHSDVPVNPFLMTIVSDDPALQRRAAELESALIGQHIQPLPFPFPVVSHPARSARLQRLRIGYFSADFHDHATSYLMAQMLESHDRQQFEIFAYSFGPNARQHAYRQRLERGIEHFHEVSALGPRAIAELARTHELDIAVDLKGHTRQGRPHIFAWRAAPLQVSYIGFPGTSGAPWMDYVVGDASVIPPGDEAFYTEQVIRLPGCYQANDTQRAVATPGLSRAQAGLPEDALVLCCFNSTFKISPEMFQVWLRILKRVPQAVLWLFDKNRQVQDTLRQCAAAQGLAPERLVFAEYAPLAQHLSRYRLADLFLDTAPYNAHTTASDALWVGLPVLTLSGRSFASRVGASLLSSLGLQELITHTLADYENLALQLCKQPTRLQQLRQRVMQSPQRADLFDGQRLAQRMASAYSHMAQRHAQGLPPKGFQV
ncbi:tetratricopeptide repeat protein [Limnohabitans sp. Jir72]|uniref:O-linked N-acetylglucosamine transferase family protein n=1 Tax=Limnohabitans sp. Jir72 TaxID=1977909 RepID=UPI001304ED46|nr:tetratricopeptide repeat protein [Limnohabitans sp. Jir72]